MGDIIAATPHPLAQGELKDGDGACRVETDCGNRVQLGTWVQLPIEVFGEGRRELQSERDAAEGFSKC